MKFSSVAYTIFSLPVIGVLTLALLSCSDGQARGGEELSIIDSAGIQIIQNPHSLPENAEQWTLGEAPLFEVPSVNPAGDTLFLVVVGSTHRISDREVLIAEPIFDDLRVLRSDGTIRVAFPCSTLVERVVPYVADSFLVSHVWDGTSVVDQQFQIGRLLNLGAVGEGGRHTGTRMVSAAFNDGTVVAYAKAEPRNPFETKPVRPTFILTRYSADGLFLNSFEPIAGREGLQIYETEVQHYEFPTPFPVGSFWVSSGANFIMGHNDRYEIEVYGSDGSLKRIVRRDWRTVPLTEEDLADYRRRVMTEMRTHMDTTLRALVVDRYIEPPQEKPAFDTLTIDKGGNLWVREHRQFSERFDSWAVFDTAGFVVTEVEVPRGLFITEIGDDYVVGIDGSFWDIGTATLRVYDLEKKQGS